MTKIRMIVVANIFYKYIIKNNIDIDLAEDKIDILRKEPFNIDLETIEDIDLCEVMCYLFSAIVGSIKETSIGIGNIYNDLVFNFGISDSEINEIYSYIK